MKRDYLTDHWTRTRVPLGSAGAVSPAALALAFWRRSLLYGLVVLDSIVLAKIAWSFFYGGESGLALLPLALVGLISCNAALRLARAVQLLQGIGDVVGGGVLVAVLQKGASLADRVGGDLRELEYEALAPIRCVAPGALGSGAATQYLAQVAAETAHERVEDRHARSTPLPLAQRREQ